MPTVPERTVVTYRSSVVLGVAIFGLLIAGAFGVAYVTTPSQGNDAQIHLQEVDDEDVDGRVVSFESLSPEQQEAFERALADPRNSTRLSDEEQDQFWYGAPAVRYENATYRISVAEPD